MSKIVTPEGITVEAGQLWRDLDKRMNGRTIKVTRVDPLNGLAHYEWPVKNRIRISRMRKPFWELVT